MLPNATPLRKSAAWPPNVSDEHVSCTAPATRNPSADPLQMSHARFWKPLRLPHKTTLQRAKVARTDILTSNVLRATTACTFSTSELPQVVRDCQFLTLLTSKCASRHNGVQFFHISTSKSAPKLVCFVHFDLEMRFAPQRRALFHLSSGQMALHPPL